MSISTLYVFLKGKYSPFDDTHLEHFEKKISQGVTILAHSREKGQLSCR